MWANNVVSCFEEKADSEVTREIPGQSKINGVTGNLRQFFFVMKPTKGTFNTIYFLYLCVILQGTQTFQQVLTF
jgi:hypothetical protein